MKAYEETKNYTYLVASISLLNSFDEGILKDGNLTHEQRLEILHTNETS